VVLDLGEDALPTTAAQVTMTATPLAPDGTPPRGTIDGNVYRITVTAPARLDPAKAQGFLWLRAAVMTDPDPVIVHRAKPTDPWVEQKTRRVGRDIMSTPFRAVGDYAVVRLPGSKPIESLSGSSSNLLRIGGVVLAALVLGAQVIRSPRAPDPH
jgi:hypothetical protein